MTKEEAERIKKLACVVDHTQATYDWFCSRVDDMVKLEYEDSSVTEMDKMQEILEKFSALCRKYQAESDCEDCPCWFGECQLHNFRPEEYDKVIQANIDATEPEEL